MAQIIIVDNNQDFSDLLNINMTTHLGLEVIPRTNAIEAIELLTILPNIELIITRSKIGIEKSADILAEHIKSSKENTTLFTIGEKDKLEFGTNFRSNNDWEQILKEAAKVLGFDPEKLAQRIDPEYVSIPAEYFYNIHSSCCDVYMRIKKASESFQYIKRIHALDSFAKEDIQRYQKEGLKNFFIKKEDESQFSVYLSNHLIAKLEDVELIEPLEGKMEVISESYEMAIKQIEAVGFTRSTVQLTETLVNSMTKTFEKYPKVSSHIQKIFSTKTSPHYQYCHMISLVSGEVIRNLGATNEEIQKYLTYAAFFHDMELQDSNELLDISTHEQLEDLKVKDEDKYNKVYNHALNAHNIILEHPEFGKVTAQIIKEHHGSAEGLGIPLTPNPKISQLSKIFLIVEDFIRTLFEFQQKGEAPRPIIEIIKERHTEESFRAIIASLNNTLIKNKKA